jgi:hypothetical protein
MKKIILRRPSAAVAIASAALFVSLGGGAYAAAALPAHSVGARQLKANSLTSVAVKDHSLLAIDFASGQLPSGGGDAPPMNDSGHGDAPPKGDTGDPGPKGDAGVKGDPGVQGDAGVRGVAGVKGDEGAKGDAGAKGDKGEKGDTGDTGPKGDTGPAARLDATVRKNSSSVPVGVEAETSVQCAAGEIALGGGGSIGLGGGISSTLQATRPQQDGTGKPIGWIAIARNGSASAQPMTVYAICAKVS